MADLEKIAEELGSLTILEASELVTMLEDKRGVTAVRDYLVYIRDEARKRFDAGMPPDEAALDISLTDYDSWGDAERIVVNVAVLYKEFAADPEPGDIAGLFALMAKVHKARRR